MRLVKFISLALIGLLLGLLIRLPAVGDSEGVSAQNSSQLRR